MSHCYSVRHNIVTTTVKATWQLVMYRKYLECI